MTELKIETVNVGQLKPYKNNAKIHTPDQISQIADSIHQFGFVNPILIDENDEIIAGHGRFEAAKVLNLPQVPVIRIGHLTNVQKRKLRIADNRISENGGGWDADLLNIEIGELCELEDIADITITGFNDIEIDQILTEPRTKSELKKLDTVPYVADDEIITVPGDIWEFDGGHRIICGDSTDRDTFAKLLDNKRVNMVLQDPPFNIKINGFVSGNGTVKHPDFAMAAGEMSDSEYTEFLGKNFALCSEYATDNAMVFNFIDWRNIMPMLTACKQHFARYINLCVWVKNKAGMGTPYRSQHELCTVFLNKAGKVTDHIQLGKYGRNRSNVWHYYGCNSYGPHRNDLKMHPTVKSFEMLSDILLDVTSIGDSVLDCFLGSGSTLIAAQRHRRICYGIEYEPKYVDTCVKRFYEAFGIDAKNLRTGKTYTQLLDEKRAHKEMQNAQ
ncbi:MAG: site-specific DNA-methyltransferase [Candidatus Enterousia sp.]